MELSCKGNWDSGEGRGRQWEKAGGRGGEEDSHRRNLLLLPVVRVRSPVSPLRMWIGGLCASLWQVGRVTSVLTIMAHMEASRTSSSKAPPLQFAEARLFQPFPGSSLAAYSPRKVPNWHCPEAQIFEKRRQQGHTQNVKTFFCWWTESTASLYSQRGGFKGRMGVSETVQH